MKLFHLLILGCLALCSATAEETNFTITVDGITYSNVTFGTTTPTSASFRHSSGIGRVSMQKLPPEIQKQLGYDPEKAADYQNRLREQNIQQLRKTLDLREVNGAVCDFSNLRRLMALAKDLEGKRPQVESTAGLAGPDYVMPGFSSKQQAKAHEGDLAAKRARLRDIEARNSQANQEWSTKYSRLREQYLPYVVQGKVQQVAADGILLNDVYVGGKSILTSVFLKHYSRQKEVVENDDVLTFALPTDNYTYGTVMGARRTIMAFDCGVPISAEDYHGRVVILPVADKRVIELP